LTYWMIIILITEKLTFWVMKNLFQHFKKKIPTTFKFWHFIKSQILEIWSHSSVVLKCSIQAVESLWYPISVMRLNHLKYFPVREAFTKIKRSNLGKSPNLFYSLPPPFNLGTLNCYFLLHNWSLKTMKCILR